MLSSYTDEYNPVISSNIVYILRVAVDHFTGDAALMVAARKGQESCIKLLLDGGANVNLQTKYGLIALIQAVVHGHESCIRLLLNAQADLNVTFRDGVSALHMAAMLMRVGIFKLLLETEGCDLLARDNINRTALWYAAKSGSLEMVQLLRNRGNVSISERDNLGMSPIDIASVMGHSQVVGWLSKQAVPRPSSTLYLMVSFISSPSIPTYCTSTSLSFSQFLLIFPIPSSSFLLFIFLLLSRPYFCSHTLISITPLTFLHSFGNLLINFPLSYGDVNIKSSCLFTVFSN